VVLASSGRSFSAGADLEWMRRMARHSFEANLADAAALAGLLHTLDACPSRPWPWCRGGYGGGVGLVACCDVAVASERAGFA
jgi:methylglutaconyl-CoA hydratase